MEKISTSDFKKLHSFTPQLLNLQVYILTNMKLPTSLKDVEPEKALGNFFLKIATTFKIFLTIARACRSLDESIIENEKDTFRSTLLASYIQYFFTNPNKVLTPYYIKVLDLWNKFLSDEKNSNVDDKNKKKDDKNIGATFFFNLVNQNKENKENKENKDIKELNFPTTPISHLDSIELSWFLFDSISKSITLYALKHNSDITSIDDKFNWTFKKFIEDDKFYNTFSDFLITFTNKIMECESPVHTKRANFDLSMFFIDLLSVSFLHDIIKTKFRANSLKLIKNYINLLGKKIFILLYRCKK
jgi:hypothetical protein